MISILAENQNVVSVIVLLSAGLMTWYSLINEPQVKGDGTLSYNDGRINEIVETFKSNVAKVSGFLKNLSG